MKRKYEEFTNPVKYNLKRRMNHEHVQISKKMKKDPIIRFIALFKGYLARKVYIYKLYPFYS